jgi:hypothetical protein
MLENILEGFPESLHFDTLTLSPIQANWVERWSKVRIISFITLLQFMVFSTRFFNQKISKNDKCKKTTLSIWTNRFVHVQRD